MEMRRYSDKLTEFKNVTVTKFAWANPHCIVEFDVKDDKGKVVNWTAETGSPEALRLAGWNKNSLRPGDVITIYLHAAKTGEPAGRFTKIVLADGTVLGDTQGTLCRRRAAVTAPVLAVAARDGSQ